MSGPLDDALAQARARLDAIKARRSTVQAELTELRAASGTKKTRAAARVRVRELEARQELLEDEMAAAHAALGRAILDQFVRDLAQVRIPQGDPDVARELMVMANNLRRACLAVLADWPELREEAERRLAPMPEGPTTVHG